MWKHLIRAMGIILAVAILCQAKMPTLGEGEKLQFDPAGIPPEYKKAYELMAVKCSNPKCHSIARAVTAINTGKAPMTKIVFDKNAAKAYGVKMMRQPDSNMDKNDARDIVTLMFYMLDQK
jgi:hypothetical protein